jgi:tRNA-splicing ligase RtcB
MYFFKINQMKIPCYVWAGEGSIEGEAIRQIENASTLPTVFHHTALMPDAHVGYGISIGSVVALDNAISPAMVGVDIGCGLCAIKTSLTEIDPAKLKAIMADIRRAIPVGFEHHKTKQDQSLMPKLKGEYKIVEQEYSAALKQIGTLGSGNHFIEIQKGSDNHIWIMVHSGSRNFGLKNAEYYHQQARIINEKNFPEVPLKWDLSFLPVESELGQMYIREMQYCVEFALANRQLMMNRICEIFKDQYPNIIFEPMINIAHNYAALETHFGKSVWVHRKGATLATRDTIGIVPGSQGSKSYIVRGLGNPESFMSCAHGAGRRLGRNEARKNLNLEKEKQILESQGILHAIRSVRDLDEAPGSYKDINEVMNNQKDLVEVLVELKPLAVIKG